MIIPLTHSETHTPLPGPLVKLTGSDEILLIELQGTLETTAARDGQHVGVLSLEADTNVSARLSLLSFSEVRLGCDVGFELGPFLPYPIALAFLLPTEQTLASGGPRPSRHRAWHTLSLYAINFQPRHAKKTPEPETRESESEDDRPLLPNSPARDRHPISESCRLATSNLAREAASVQRRFSVLDTGRM